MQKLTNRAVVPVKELSPIIQSTRFGLLTCAAVFALSGCAALEGVNVGVGVPIGGIANAGVNTTLGKEKKKAPTGAQGRQPSAEQSSSDDSQDIDEAEEKAKDVTLDPGQG